MNGTGIVFKPLGIVSDTKYARIIDTFWKLRYVIGAGLTRHHICKAEQRQSPRSPALVRISSPAKVARTRIRNVP
jgi:hypothetical protein